jgi:hypothetical protein
MACTAYIGVVVMGGVKHVCLDTVVSFACVAQTSHRRKDIDGGGAIYLGIFLHCEL